MNFLAASDSSVWRLFARGQMNGGILLGLLIGVPFAWWISRSRPRFRAPRLFSVTALAIAALLITIVAIYRWPRVKDPHNFESLRLPPGYTLWYGPAEDSYVGSIIAPDGREIRMDVGSMAGIFADPREREKYDRFSEWIVEGHKAYVADKRYPDPPSRFLFITFEKGWVNFIARIDRDEEVEEVRKLVMTYRPRD